MPRATWRSERIVASPSSQSPSMDMDEIEAVATSTEPLNTASLQGLQSKDERKVMDIVDKLRNIGLNGELELPQLVVCGDQSSGKSSVLEAITEIPFPRKENLCTRFATQIVLRRSISSNIQVTIYPDQNRPAEEIAKLKTFDKSFTDFSQLPDIIEQATETMGLGKVGENNSRAFSRDVLSVEICGPDRPQLTLVDLPGLIHATNKAQTAADKELILDLVKEYMQNPRTIILAVVSAKNDFANQVILEHCMTIDKKRERTLGIITKPDYLREGSRNEEDWIELAQNKNIFFKLGWHIVKNRGETEMDFTFDQRNDAETMFFARGRYKDLHRDTVGVGSLRKRLSRLLFTHLVQELPSLREEIMEKLRSTKDEIEQLGEKRVTIQEQRDMLMRISMQTHDIVKSAVNGYYHDEFFATVNTGAAVDSEANITRFRAVVQHLNSRFATGMRLHGHKYAFESGSVDDSSDSEDNTIPKGTSDDPFDKLPTDVFPTPKALSREGAVAWAKRIHVRSRGSELPGNFNPALISQLFWENSQPWEEIALDHLEAVAHKCREFVYKVLQHTAPPEFKERITTLTVDAALQNALADGKAELKKLVADKSRHPITYNHYYTTTIQKMRQNKQREALKKAQFRAEVSVYSNNDTTSKRYLDPATMEAAMENSIILDMDKFSAEEALDLQRAFYKTEMKYFVDAVCKISIERHLVHPLPDIILSPLTVAKFTDDEVEYAVAEPLEVTQRREHLEAHKAMLEAGMKLFKEVMGGMRR